VQLSALNQEEKGQLASMVIELLDQWAVDTEGQILVLSLPEKTPLRAIRKYRKCTPFPESDQIMERVEHIIGIAEALRTTYPRNSQMGSQWMNKPHKRFDGKTPVQLMVEGGLKGVIQVRSQLDCAFAWENS